MGWACAAAPDGIAWYVAWLFAAVCLLDLLCPTRSHGTLLCYRLKWAVPALLRPTGSHGKLLCYSLQCAGPVLMCPTRSHGKSCCAKSAQLAFFHSHLVSPWSLVMGNVAFVLCTTNLSQRVGESPQRARCGPRG